MIPRVPARPVVEPAAALSGPALEAVRAIGHVASSHGTSIYFVGGVPRDLVLGRPIGTDLDIVAVGDAVALARAVRASAGGEATLHARFGTATWRMDGISIDLITARRERYARPAALPDVAPGTLDDDLARRDFTVNTLAIAIEHGAFGPLIDRHGGVRDLADGVVRALHAASFVDDPTRVFRAVRAEMRFGLTMEPATEGWARAAVAGIAALSGRRVLTELRQMFDPAIERRALARLADLGALHHLGPEPLSASGSVWSTPDATGDAVAAGATSGATSDATRRMLAWLAANGSAGVRCGERLHLTAHLQRDLATAAELARLPLLAVPTAATSAVNAAIAHRRPTLQALDIAAASADDSVARSRLADYAAVWLDRPLPIDGDDVIALGVTPGPAVGATLAAVRDAWWDGLVDGRAAAIAFVRRRLQSPPAPGRVGPDRDGPML